MRIKRAILIALLLVFAVSTAWAAGSCTQTNTQNNPNSYIVTFVCSGDGTTGSIPDTALNSVALNSIMKNTPFLYSVTAYSTSGGIAPDAADVLLYMNGEDLLGGKGTNLIHATATQTTLPYSAFMSSYFYPAIVGAVTLRVANQATASANYTIVLDFER